MACVQRQQLLAEFRAHYGKGVLQLPAFMAALQTRGADFARALFQKLDAGGLAAQRPPLQSSLLAMLPRCHRVASLLDALQTSGL